MANNHIYASHPQGAICITHGVKTMNVYQGGSHRNYSCQAKGCKFQVYRHPCPVCWEYFGSLSDDGCALLPCVRCAYTAELAKVRGALVDAGLSWHRNMLHGTDGAGDAWSGARDEDEDALADAVIAHDEHLAKRPPPPRFHDAPNHEHTKRWECIEVTSG